MGTITKIALRNLARHKGRTIRSAVTIGVALLFFILMDSVMAGLDRGAIDNMIELSTAAITVHTNDYEQEKKALPLDFGITNIQELEEIAGKDPRIIAIAPRTQFLGQVSNYEETAPVMGVVVDPLRDTLVFSLLQYLEGEYFSQNSRREVILGKNLADEMNVGPGDYITLYALTRYESRNADAFRITGVLNTTDPNINRGTAMIPYAAANDFLDLDGLVTGAKIALQRRVNAGDMIADAREVQAFLRSEISGVVVHTFADLGAGFLAMSKQKRSFGIALMAVILLIAAVGIFNSVLMSVYERVRETGVLRAHGMHAAEIMRMFALEGFFTGAFGSCIGVAAGFAANWAIVTFGYPLDSLAGNIDTAGMPVWGTIYGEWNAGAFVFAFVFGVLLSTLAGVLPARQAGAMPIIRALKFV